MTSSIHSTNSSFPLFSVQPVEGSSSNLSEAEVAAQAGMNLSEIELLALQNPAPGSAGYEELQRVVGLYLGSGGYEATVTDPTIKPLIQQMIALIAPDGTVGSITSASIKAFTSSNFETTLDTVATWLNNGGYNLTGYSSSDTIVAYTFFMLSLYNTNISIGMTGAQGDQLLGTHDIIPTTQRMAQVLLGFMAVHSDNQGLGGVIDSILQSQEGFSQTYDAFANYFHTNYSTFTTSDPETYLSGQTYAVQRSLVTLLKNNPDYLNELTAKGQVDYIENEMEDPQTSAYEITKLAETINNQMNNKVEPAWMLNDNHFLWDFYYMSADTYTGETQSIPAPLPTDSNGATLPGFISSAPISTVSISNNQVTIGNTIQGSNLPDQTGLAGFAIQQTGGNSYTPFSAPWLPGGSSSAILVDSSGNRGSLDSYIQNVIAKGGTEVLTSPDGSSYYTIVSLGGNNYEIRVAMPVTDLPGDFTKLAKDLERNPYPW